MPGSARDLVQVGLCCQCRYVRVLGNDRGSQFYQCRRSQDDETFRKYPALPMWNCSGYQPDRPPSIEPSPATA